MSDIGTMTNEITIDEEASDVMKSVDTIMQAVASACPDGTGRERAIDLHKALLALNGCTTILLKSVPEPFRTKELDMFVEALKHGNDLVGAKVTFEGGRA